MSKQQIAHFISHTFHIAKEHAGCFSGMSYSSHHFQLVYKLADGLARSEQTLRQLQVFPLPMANFTKSEEQRALSPGSLK